MARDLETIVRISGELDAKLKNVIEKAQRQIEELGLASEKASDAVDKMTDKIGEQSDELKKAQKQYAAYILNGEESSDQAKELAQKIKTLSSELKDNKSKLSAAETAAQKLADGLDDVDDAARDTKGGFTVMKGALANLVSSGIQTLIGKCSDAVSSLWGLADSTREFRQDMGTLETAYARAGFAAETAGDTWRDLYAIFGEDDRAVEAANNIARMAKNEADLQKWVKITTGIWGTYQDALPVEGLAEAASETINTGAVTGVMADALNWSTEAAEKFAKYMSDDVTTAEDAFNVALSKCTTEAERQALVTDTLIDLYGTAADKYDETAESVMEANRATADFTSVQAKLGEKIEPVTTSVRQGFTKILEKLLELASTTDMDAFAQKVDDGFSYFIETVLPKVVSGIDWIIEHKDQIAAIGGAVAVVSGALGVLNGVLAVQSAIMAANPTTWIILDIIAAIAALVAAGVALYKNWDTIKVKAGELWSKVTEKWNGLKTSAKETVDGIKKWFTDGFDALVGIVKGPIDKVQGMIDGVKNKLSSIKDSVTDKISGVASKVGIKLPAFATGGFTAGPSIAGEAGMEAVISFDRRVREANLGYWAQAGRLLGATADDASFALSGSSDGGTVIDMGGVTFAPNISFSGQVDRESVIEAIKAEYPEFLDILESWLLERGVTVFA